MASPSNLLTPLTNGRDELDDEDFPTWCRQNIFVTRGDRQGLLRLDPHQIQPLQDTIDQHVLEVILEWSSQLGKSVILPARIGWSIARHPEDILVMMSGEKGIDKFFREKLLGVLMGSRAIWPKIRKNNRGSVSQHGFDFDGGGLTITTPRSVSGEHGNSTPLVMLDELDDYPPEFELDGMIQRGVSFRNRKVITMSAVAKTGESKIHKRYLMGHQAVRYAPCCHCGHYQILVLAQVRRGALHCVECHRPWTEGERLASLRAGEWRPQNPSQRRRRSYWCSQLYSVQIPLERTLVDVEGMTTAHISTQIEAWPYEEHEVAPVDPDKITRRRPDESPAIRTVGVDVQGDRLIWYMVEFAEDLATSHVRARGFIARSATAPRQAFYELRRAVAGLGVMQLTCDIGFEPDVVLDGLKAAWPDAFRHADTVVEGVRGSAKAGGTFGEPLRGNWRNEGYFVGAVDESKRLVQTDANEGRLTLDPDLDDSVAQEIASERCVRQADARGNVRLRWVNPENAPNHALDCVGYAYMGALKVLARLRIMSPSSAMTVGGIK